MAALLSLTAQLIEMGVGFYKDELAAGTGIFGWLPQLRTAGDTIVAYSYASEIAVFGLSILGVATLGYWAGLHLDLTTQYRSLLGYLTGGGGVGLLLALLLWGPIIGESVLPFGATWGPTIAALLLASITMGIKFALVGFAGAALATFRFDGVARCDDVSGTDPNPQLDPD